jgi:hypothetical protein
MQLTLADIKGPIERLKRLEGGSPGKWRCSGARTCS